MKTLLSLCVIAFIACTFSLTAQQQYTVDGQSLLLKAEVEGPLTLLWNTIDGEYRYFSKKENSIAELTNTRVDGDYQEEYKEIIRSQTSDVNISFADVDLTLPSLSDFFVKYNKLKDPNYTFTEPVIKLDLRLGVFGGITNSVYTENSTNAKQPVFGADLEIIDEVKLRRHSVVVRFKQTLSNSEYSYSASQVSLNYRFKFIKTPTFDMFINTKFVAFTNSSRDVTVVTPGEADMPVVTIVKESGSNFQAPGAFGLGADLALGNGYLTFSYNDIVALGVESNGDFPVDFTLGYKFNL